MGTMENIGKKIDDMGEKIADKASDVTTAAGVKGLEAEEAVKERLADAQGEFAALRENSRLGAEKAQGQIRSMLLEAQMNFRQKRDEAHKAFDDYKADTDKKSAARKVHKADNYAAAALQNAEEAVDESDWAVKNAAKLRQEYVDKYGEVPPESEDEDDE